MTATYEELPGIIRALADLRDAARRTAAPGAVLGLVALADEIREEIEVLDQCGQPYNDLLDACDQIDQGRPAAAADMMDRAIESLRALTAGAR